MINILNKLFSFKPKVKLYCKDCGYWKTDKCCYTMSGKTKKFDRITGIESEEEYYFAAQDLAWSWLKDVGAMFPRDIKKPHEYLNCSNDCKYFKDKKGSK
jgi:hypothetical protein